MQSRQQSTTQLIIPYTFPSHVFCLMPAQDLSLETWLNPEGDPTRSTSFSPVMKLMVNKLLYKDGKETPAYQALDLSQLVIEINNL